MSVLNIDVKELTHVKSGTIFCPEATLQDRKQDFTALNMRRRQSSTGRMEGPASLNTKPVLEDETTQTSKACDFSAAHRLQSNLINLNCNLIKGQLFPGTTTQPVYTKHGIANIM